MQNRCMTILSLSRAMYRVSHCIVRYPVIPTPYIHGGVTLSVEAVLQHQTQSAHLLGVEQPGAILHPGWVGGAFSTYHQEHRPPVPVELLLHKVPLGGNNKGFGGEDCELNP